MLAWKVCRDSSCLFSESPCLVCSRTKLSEEQCFLLYLNTTFFSYTIKFIRVPFYVFSRDGIKISEGDIWVVLGSKVKLGIWFKYRFFDFQILISSCILFCIFIVEVHYEITYNCGLLLLSRWVLGNWAVLGWGLTWNKTRWTKVRFENFTGTRYVYSVKMKIKTSLNLKQFEIGFFLF